MVSTSLLYCLLLFALSAAASTRKSLANSPQGCFRRIDGLKNLGAYRYNSISYCNDRCRRSKRDFAAVKGKYCACGSSLPSVDDVVSDNECDEPCPGYSYVTCGGKKVWSVWAIGSDEPSARLSTTTAISTSTADASSTALETSPEFSSIPSLAHVIEPPASTSSSQPGDKALGEQRGSWLQVPLLGDW
ncbi:plasma membrane sensor transducer [Aspergillus ustus]|uniref:Plasma membrane sensor transducer n=1 Tax=Aspergillus ustus TaxID=40382 RepID=A0A0C1E392_ASPUT|nr:plasma membrane sensor transducer [Aspergillus ustus]